MEAPSGALLGAAVFGAGAGIATALVVVAQHVSRRRTRARMPHPPKRFRAAPSLGDVRAIPSEGNLFRHYFEILDRPNIDPEVAALIAGMLAEHESASGAACPRGRATGHLRPAP
jgi:hypothetical protein